MYFAPFTATTFGEKCESQDTGASSRKQPKLDTQKGDPVCFRLAATLKQRGGLRLNHLAPLYAHQ
jgi:hypothetical protein